MTGAILLCAMIETSIVQYGYIDGAIESSEWTALELEAR